MNIATYGEEEDYNAQETDQFVSDIGEFHAGNATSYLSENFDSEEMRRLVLLEEPEEKIASGLHDISYKSSIVFPDWILTSNDWRVTRGKKSGNEISDILQVPYSSRTQDQNMVLIEWIMSVWPIAGNMGLKRVGMMVKEFKYFVYEPDVNIITEGERGLTFYIIISGEVDVYKEGLGKVGHLDKGRSFGEIALTQGKDLRTATIRAVTRVEVLSLHKVDYDHFVKDIQLGERREHFHLLRECKLFENWPRVKIEKMANTCSRRSYEPGAHVFRQGDDPDNLYFIFEGSVNIVKEVHIVCKNRWPSSHNTWEECSKKVVKPILVANLAKGAYFGEVSIIQQAKRSASAIAASKTTLVLLDRQEFLHLLNTGRHEFSLNDTNMKSYRTDQDVLQTIKHVNGGPSSVVYAGEAIKYPNQSFLKRVIRPKAEPEAAPAYQYVPPTEVKKKIKNDLSDRLERYYQGQYVSEKKIEKYSDSLQEVASEVKKDYLTHKEISLSIVQASMDPEKHNEHFPFGRHASLKFIDADQNSPKNTKINPDQADRSFHRSSSKSLVQSENLPPTMTKKDRFEFSHITMEAHRVASKPGSALGYVANRDVLTPSQAFAATSMPLSGVILALERSPSPNQRMLRQASSVDLEDYDRHQEWVHAQRVGSPPNNESLLNSSSSSTAYPSSRPSSISRNSRSGEKNGNIHAIPSNNQAQARPSTTSAMQNPRKANHGRGAGPLRASADPSTLSSSLPVLSPPSRKSNVGSAGISSQDGGWMMMTNSGDPSSSSSSSSSNHGTSHSTGHRMNNNNNEIQEGNGNVSSNIVNSYMISPVLTSINSHWTSPHRRSRSRSFTHGDPDSNSKLPVMASPSQTNVSSSQPFHLLHKAKLSYKDVMGSD